MILLLVLLNFIEYYKKFFSDKMSCASDLNELMKELNKKFRQQRQLHEQEKREWMAKLESVEARLKERTDEAATLRQQLLTMKKRNLELEKLVVDQNSLIHRMRSKLQISLDNTLNGSNSEGANGSRLEKPILEDKCVSTDDWHTILEKELTERIEHFAAYMNAKKDQESRISGGLSNGYDTSNRSNFDHRSENVSAANRTRKDQESRISGGLSNGYNTSNRSNFDQRSGNFSNGNRTRFTNEENDDYAAARASKSREKSHHHRSSKSVIGNGISEYPPLSLAAAHATSTPATSVWQASTPLSNRHHSRNGNIDMSNNDHSLPFDDTLRDLPTHLDTSALEADLLQKFSELETEAQALFDMDDFGEENRATSKISSIVTDE